MARAGTGRVVWPCVALAFLGTQLRLDNGAEQLGALRHDEHGRIGAILDGAGLVERGIVVSDLGSRRNFDAEEPGQQLGNEVGPLAEQLQQAFVK